MRTIASVVHSRGGASVALLGSIAFIVGCGGGNESGSGGAASSNASSSSSVGAGGGSTSSSSSSSAGGGSLSGAITVAPTSATLSAGASQTFSCSVTGFSDTTCTWSVKEGSAGGTITAAGAYTAPPLAGTFHVVATSHAEPSLNAAATVVVPAVGDCAGLPAVGTWEKITPPDFTSPPNMQTLSVVVNPQQPNIVFATAGNITNGASCPQGQTCPPTGSGVYMSNDCGKTFTKVSTGKNSNLLFTGDPWALRIASNLDLYLANGYGKPATLFKSTNGGVDWTNLFTDPVFTTPLAQGGTFNYGGFVRSFDLDPSDDKHVLVAFHEDCHGPVAASANDAVNGAVMCLAESRDAGATWTLFEGPIPPAAADGGAPLILGKDTLLYANPSGAYYTSDPMRKKASFSQVVTYDKSHGFNAINQSGAYWGPDGTLYMGTGLGVLSSPPGPMLGQTWTAIAKWPSWAMVVAGDGLSLFSSVKLDGTTQHVYTAPLGALSPVTTMNTPAGWNGVETFAYDPVHHILYSATGSDGLWRVVTH